MLITIEKSELIDVIKQCIKEEFSKFNLNKPDNETNDSGWPDNYFELFGSVKDLERPLQINSKKDKRETF